MVIVGAHSSDLWNSRVSRGRHGKTCLTACGQSLSKMSFFLAISILEWTESGRSLRERGLVENSSASLALLLTSVYFARRVNGYSTP